MPAVSMHISSLSSGKPSKNQRFAASGRCALGLRQVQPPAEVALATRRRLEPRRLHRARHGAGAHGDALGRAAEEPRRGRPLPAARAAAHRGAAEGPRRAVASGLGGAAWQPWRPLRWCCAVRVRIPSASTRLSMRPRTATRHPRDRTLWQCFGPVWSTFWRISRPKKIKKRPLWPRGLVIFHIEPHSAVVARWNAGHSDRCLASRQVIVSINGIEAMEDMVGH